MSLLVAGRLAPPADVGRWAPGPLSDEVVLALEPADDAVLVGTRRGLYRLDEAGSVRDLPVRGPVLALARDGARTWVGTDEGVLSMRDRRATPEALTGVAVHALDARDGTVVAASDTGVHRRSPSGTWQQLWPTSGTAETSVATVLTTRHGILFDHPEGLALRHPDGSVDVVLPGVEVVALGRWPGPGAVWVGTRGGPLLMVSEDDGLTWQVRSDGLGFSAVHAVAPDPLDGGSLIAGGSGLADGTGNAGTQRTEDGGRTWRAEQNRLSNTHVYALLAREEPVRLGAGITGTALHGAAALPISTIRWYAGTNGGGVSTYRPESPLLTAAAEATPYLRLAEPVLAGVLLLAVLLPAYRHLDRTAVRRPRLRGPPRGPPPTEPRPPSAAERPQPYRSDNSERERR